MLKTLTHAAQVMRKHMPGNTSMSHPIALLALQGGPRGMTDLSILTSTSTAALTGLGNSLVHAGVVERVHGPDRRRVMLALTEKGRQVVQEMLTSEDAQ